MGITKKQLDVRICDFEPETENTETYREFIQNSEDEFEIERHPLDEMSDEELNNHLEFLDYLWGK